MLVHQHEALVEQQDCALGSGHKHWAHLVCRGIAGRALVAGADFQRFRVHPTKPDVEVDLGQCPANRYVPLPS